MKEGLWYHPVLDSLIYIFYDDGRAIWESKYNIGYLGDCDQTLFKRDFIYIGEV